MTALFVGLIVTPAVIRAAAARGLYDIPGGRRVHTTPVPRLGGIAVVGATLAGLLAGALLAPGPHAAWLEFLPAVLAGGLILFGMGLVDDLRGLSPQAKLAGQLLAAAVVFHYGLRVEAITVGGQANVSVGWLSFPLTLLWIVGVTNAYNLIDGLDGLATGLGVVALATILAVALLLGHADVALIAAALIGALLGFLPYNFNPARIFLGDSGSLFVGFLLAVLSVRASTKSSTAVLVLVPLLALGVPLLDTVISVLRRWLRGMSFTAADRRHIHHRLLSVGFSTRGAVLVLYAVSSVAAMLAVVAVFAPPQGVAYITYLGGGVSLLLLVYGVKRLGYHEFDAAGHLALRFPVRLRKVLRDRINAQDLAEVLRVAGSMEEINAILQDSAETFEFGYVEVCRLHEGASPEDICASLGERVWRVDYPLTAYDPHLDSWLVLRVWCRLDSRAPNGTERVATILGPVIASWIAEEAARRPALYLHRTEKAVLATAS
jgi:UDP-GlcNAc:undecaprenyl-phosphate GlcNAc-1-phosphate transferase